MSEREQGGGRGRRSEAWRQVAAVPDHRAILRDMGLSGAEARSVLARIVGLVLRYPWSFALATLTSLGATVFNLFVPRLLGRAVDEAHGLAGQGVQVKTALAALSATAVLVVASQSMRGLLQMISGYQSERLGQCVARDLRLAFYEKLQTLGFDYHDRIHSGDLISRGMLDLEGVRGFIENGLQRAIALVLLLGVGAAMLLSRDLTMGLLALSFTPFAAWRALRMGLRLRWAWTRLQERMGVLTRVMEESLQGSRVVRAHAAHEHEMARFDETGDAALALSNQRIAIRSSSLAVINLSYYAAMGLVLWVGGHRIAEGSLTVGRLTEDLAFMTILQLPVRQISMIMNSSARAVSSGRRVFEVLDLEPVIRDAPGARALVVSEGVLGFEGVCFSYGGADAPRALEDVSFTVRPGRTLGVVGPSGSGKTTIAQLIPRFYDVTSGRITIDGQDLREVTLDSLRQAVAVIQQDVFLFDDSVANNIAYADPDAEDAAVTEAAGVAQIHDHVSVLPRGYDSPVGERGSNLSGGQRQRVAIARGLTPDPAILVFDDATSALDAATEHKLRQALREATKNRATIIISHRLGSLMHADEILVINGGRVIERGDHRSLLARRGYYAELYRLQSEGAPQDLGVSRLREALA